MFHRTVNKKLNNNKADNNKSAENIEFKKKSKTYTPRVESSAVERYAKYRKEQSAGHDIANTNQSMDGPVEMIDNENYADHNFEQPVETNYQNQTQFNNSQNQIEEDNFMNNPEPQQKNNEEKAIAPQNRDVNIPGNNFKRPAQVNPANAQAAGRPSYPGTYGASSANNPYASQGNSGNGRKLVIGQGITMSGEIEACEHLIVEGTIEATLKGANVLDVYESGAFLGTVEIDEANIAGRFEGDITVKGRLTIEATGQVIGTISYKELSMEAGAVIDGAVSPIGSTNAAANATKKSSAPKAKKASTDTGAELPFSDKGQAAE